MAKKISEYTTKELREICQACHLTPEKKKEHVSRVISELKEGKRRPCCWYGCIHRKDKALSPTQKFIRNKQTKKRSD